MGLYESIQALEVPSFRKKQIVHAVYKEYASTFLSITSLPLELRHTLEHTFQLRTLSIQKVLESADKKTVKWSLLTKSNNPIETVLMLHENGRRTLCISCQSGCPVNCSFCWTGAMGFRQNLSCDEIIEQVLLVNEYLKGKNLDSINRVVFMGMGEPMINLLEVTKAVEMLTDPEIFSMSQRSITVSTSGYIPMMRKFWTQFPKVGLAISLHASNQQLRESLMPVAKQFHLDDLIQVCDEIQKNTKRRATYEYILIDQVTDTEESARELSQLLKNQMVHVNLIPYNPIAGRSFQRPSRNRVMRFCKILKEYGISATPRVTMGDDIKAACGQLSAENTTLPAQ